MTRLMAFSLSVVLLLFSLACTKTVHPVGATRDLPAGTVLQAADMEVMYDTENLGSDGDAVVVTDKTKLIGKRLRQSISKHQQIFKTDVF